tara:strand:+ start:161 stop:433 length:273 start_codon:yes stop_codon:yes gene_type:complete
MSEQQEHLKNLVNQRDAILSEIQGLNAQIAGKRELALRATGAIEYLQQIGVELPSAEEAPPAPEAPAPEGETVNGDEPLPPPVFDGQSTT